jgi:hypothetical protein
MRLQIIHLRHRAASSRCAWLNSNPSRPENQTLWFQTSRWRVSFHHQLKAVHVVTKPREWGVEGKYSPLSHCFTSVLASSLPHRLVTSLSCLHSTYQMAWLHKSSCSQHTYWPSLELLFWHSEANHKNPHASPTVPAMIWGAWTYLGSHCPHFTPGMRVGDKQLSIISGTGAVIWSKTNLGASGHHHPRSSPLLRVCTVPSASAIF